MRVGTLLNILSQGIKPKRFQVMAKKVTRRLHDYTNSLAPETHLQWLKEHCSGLETVAAVLEPALWKESQDFALELKASSQVVLDGLGYTLGGGGMYPFLYFLTRYRQPQTVLETGVAAGFSSAAFLSAMQVNRGGRLLSSDFPYFRLPNPERFIGAVVDPALRENWTLLVEGDEANLPKLLRQGGQVDLFHYDSDKSYAGRVFAMNLVMPYLSPEGLVLMDDIQDNTFFYDHILKHQPSHWSIFTFEGKYVGLIGDLKISARP